GKRVRLDVTNCSYIAYVGVMCLDDPSVFLDEGSCLSQKRIKAADEVITPSVATIQLTSPLAPGRAGVSERSDSFSQDAKAAPSAPPVCCVTRGVTADGLDCL